MIGSDTRELGVIAQNVQKVLPEAVSVVEPEKGYLGVNYICFDRGDKGAAGDY